MNVLGKKGTDSYVYQVVQSCRHPSGVLPGQPRKIARADGVPQEVHPAQEWKVPYGLKKFRHAIHVESMSSTGGLRDFGARQIPPLTTTLVLTAAQVV